MKALACITCLTCLACSQGFRTDEARAEKGAQVIQITAAEVDLTASAQESAAEACTSWRLTAAQAELFFMLSKKIDSRTYHHTYDTMPCKISGVVKADGKVWKFTINGAAKAQWWTETRIRYFGCEAKECEPLVIDPYVDPSGL